MKQTEYEQKRRECWEQFLRLGGTEGGRITAEAFIIAFDRAYSLGQQEIKQESKQETDVEETVISGWVFVDETTFDRILCVRMVTQGDYEAVWDSGHPEFCLGEELFPDMVPNTLPEPVEIILKRKKNG